MTISSGYVTRRTAAKFGLLAGLGAAGLSGRQARAADDAVLQAAKKEGSVLMYSPAPSSALDRLTKAFNAKYPAIKAEYYRANSAQVYERLTAEVAANRVECDIIHASDPATITDLKNAGILASYHSPEYDAYDPKYIDKDDTWFVARGHLLLLGYSTIALTPQQAPTSWKDLLDARYKGKCGIMDVRNAGGAYYWQYAVWKLYGPSYFQQMFKNQPKVYQSYGPINDHLITGELSIGADLNYLTDQAIIEEKAPVAASYPVEGCPVIWSPVGIVKKAPHPNAAKLFMDFLATPEGQQAFNHEYTYSMRKGVSARAGMKPLDQIKLMDLSVADMIAQQKVVQAAARGAWGY
jgi:iron(III) transport system substrate-binding protein